MDSEQVRRLTSAWSAHMPGDPSFTPIKTGRHNASYWVDTCDGRFEMRVAPPDDAGLLFYEKRMMRQEPGIHRTIRSRTNLPVPRIAAYDFTRTHLDRDFVILDEVPGRPVSELGLTPAQFGSIVFQVGEALRALHGIVGDSFGYVGGDGADGYCPMAPARTWGEAFETMWRRLLDDIVACGAYSPGEAASFQTLFDHHRGAFEHQVRPRLLHMDIWHENILVEGDRVTGIVDFDRAVWGDEEIEFAVLDYTGYSGPEFWRGYGRKRDESPEAAVRRRFYLLYEVQKYMPIEAWRGGGTDRAVRCRRHSFQIAEELGLAAAIGRR